MPELQPNILFVMSDQHRGDCLSLAEHPVLLTPNLDMIGGEGGTWFSRAYSTCPSCIPARRALLTGRHPANNGLVGFRGGVPITGATLPGELQRAGYQTHLVGRTMHQDPPSCRYGYDHQVLGSTYERDAFYDDITAALPDSDGGFGSGCDFNGWNARPWHTDERYHPTYWTVSRALEFLARRDETCPFFLTVSFYAPHPPLSPPAFYFDRYLRQDLGEPTIGEWAEAPAGGARGRSIAAARTVLSGEAARSAMAGYFGLINHIDDQFCRLRRAVGGIRDGRPLVIVFASDHGEMLGDHYYFRKCEPYEGSARVPLMITGTGLAGGGRCDRPVCLEDIMPTLLELAGCEPPPDLDGRSLVPLLRGEQPAAWRPFVHGEHAPCYSAEQAHHYLTDGRHKYIWRPLDGREQLFDLQADPQERSDLARNAAAAELLGSWRRHLIEQLRERPEAFTDGQRLISGRPYADILPDRAD